MLSLLVLADAHLGRHPSRIPHNKSALRVHAVWDAAIDYAITHNVDAVAIVGDLIDSNNKYFEAYGTVRRGLNKLAQAQIAAFAVAGNHDHDVLPRLADDIGLHLLGRDGTWQTVPLRKGNQVVAWFTGWSFPSEHYAQSPLEDFRPPQKHEPVIGMVHGDLDAPSSKYAPLDLATLQAHPLAIWLLGHIHKPMHIASRGTPVLYPGSLQPLDPGEPGRHGPWMLHIDASGKVTAQHVPLASVHYMPLTIDITETKSLEAVQSEIANRVNQETNRLHREYRQLQHVSYRPTLVGQSPLHRDLVTSSMQDVQDLEYSRGELYATVDKIITATTPARNLKNIARFRDPPGTIARWIQELQQDDKEAAVRRELIQGVLDGLSEMNRKNKYRCLDALVLGQDAIRAQLAKQGHLLVDVLMAQKEADS